MALERTYEISLRIEGGYLAIRTSGGVVLVPLDAVRRVVG